MTNLPTPQTDVWTPATEMDRTGALAALSTLPARASSRLDRVAYHVALEGVTRWGLTEAVKAILRGALGHAFFPSPPELRVQCDKAMWWHEREAEKIRRRERENADWARQRGDWRPPTEAEKARARETYARFCAGHPMLANPPPRLDPDLVARVPDNPTTLPTGGWPRAHTSADARNGREPLNSHKDCRVPEPSDGKT